MTIRQQIPDAQGVQDPTVARILQPMKTIIDAATGRQPTLKPIVTLGANATLSGVINKLNEVINRLQG